MYLLDTSLCIKILRNEKETIKKLHSIKNAYVSTCVVVMGELIYGALLSEMKENNLILLKKLASDIEIHEINQDTAEIYAELKTEIVNYYGPKVRVKRKRSKVTELGFDENDLWIASVALQRGLTVVSGDRDFVRIRDVCGVDVEDWFD